MTFPQDFIDLAPSGHGEDQEVVAAADVCLFGLNIIMPLMSRDLLKLPSLCSQYFKMVTFIAEIYPSKVCMLPEELMKVITVGSQVHSQTKIDQLSFQISVTQKQVSSAPFCPSPASLLVPHSVCQEGRAL